MNSRILITDLSGLSRGTPPDPGPWTYLGTDLEQRARATRLLGEKRRVEIGGRLSAAMTALRRPFQDFIASLGAVTAPSTSTGNCVPNEAEIVWWSSRLSWRMWTTSDLFLLICYSAVARELIREAEASDGKLVIVVEDPWLLRQIRETPKTGTGYAVPGTDLRIEKLQLALLGIARRAWWLLLTLKNLAVQWVFWVGKSVKGPEKPAAAIFSYPMKSSLQEKGGWRDHHLPGVGKVLEEAGWKIFRVAPPDNPGFEREFAARASYFRPLILFATLPKIWRSLTALWRPKWPANPSVGELPVGKLLEREWWLDAARSSFCGFRLYYETLDGLLSRGSWGPLVFSYENQPWEKLAVLAARKHGARTVGIQTAILSPDYLPYGLGRGEAARMPIPDQILTSGPYAQKVLEEGGFPRERVKICGAIRYKSLTEPVAGDAGGRPPVAATEPGYPPSGGWAKEVPGARQGDRPPAEETPAAGPATGAVKVLVVLPIHPPVCEDLLEVIRRVFPDGGKKARIELIVRPHPLYGAGAAKIPFPAKVLPSSFKDIGEALAGCDAVLFTGSTVGFEAAAAGRPALRYRPETTLDVDKEVYGEAFPSCGAGELKEKLLALVKPGPPPGWEKAARAQVLQLFSPVNLTAVREALSAASPTQSSSGKERSVTV